MNGYRRASRGFPPDREDESDAILAPATALPHQREEIENTLRAITTPFV
jgi:hypothetical protein